MRFTFRNDFKSYGYFHVLPELEISFGYGPEIRYVRLAFLTHEVYIDLHKHPHPRT